MEAEPLSPTEFREAATAFVWLAAAELRNDCAFRSVDRQMSSYLRVCPERFVFCRSRDASSGDRVPNSIVNLTVNLLLSLETTLGTTAHWTAFMTMLEGEWARSDGCCDIGCRH